MDFLFAIVEIFTVLGSTSDPSNQGPVGASGGPIGASGGPIGASGGPIG
jgi:hypothetical protein